MGVAKLGGSGVVFHEILGQDVWRLPSSEGLTEAGGWASRKAPPAPDLALQVIPERARTKPKCPL